ncbi:M20/M25/M40 family metallo-hydrolase [Sediminibacillus dalangtanensis]|uniref:M20/M25/M40 family metallo-hydrolase n=1 Tax=Sediminibacillus dalangtanensis TaxID=2729421 RepID=A0ABX7VRH6_9BACI|nr:M20 family metallopeptidase [Sediminibacillus dalangtanensis]QTM99128.1 M20/M25/M40 family metallo-hydrolase [Sediminibacillus dalangtanensis]
MNLEKKLESKMPEMTALLEELVNMDSNTHDKEDVDKVGTLLKTKFEQLGMYVHTHREKKLGNNLEVKAERSSEPKIIIVAHMDTVFPKGTAKERPFEIIDDFAYGPGVSDEKSSHVAVLYALKALKESGSDAYKNVHVIFNSDEEIGSPTSKPLIKKAAADKHYSLVVESGRPGDAVVSERKGVGRFDIEVEGKGAHAGVEPELGRSAINELAHKVIKLQNLNDYESGLSVNVGLFNGGTSSNTVPPDADAKIDVRVKDKQQAKEVTKEISDIADEDTVEGTSTYLEGGMAQPPMEKTEETEKLLDVIRDAGKELGMSIKDVGTGGASDAAYTADEGIPTVDGMGPLGEYSHSLTEEYVDLTTFAKRTALLARTIQLLTPENQ